MDRVPERRLIEHRSCASRVVTFLSSTLDLQQRFSNPVRRLLTVGAPSPNLRKARRGAYFLSGRGLITRATATRAAHRIFCRSRQLNLPQNNKLDLCLFMLKMHKLRGEVVKMPMHYALCTFAHKCTDRAPFPPDLMRFQKYALLPYASLHFLLYLVLVVRSLQSASPSALTLSSRGQLHF